MLKIISALIKLGLFSILVLVLGHYIHFEGHTVSEHVKTHLGQAEGSQAARQLKTWAGSLTEDARHGHARMVASEPALNVLGNRDEIRTSSAGARRSESAGPKVEPQAAQDTIAVTERQKLRALIRELNSGH